MRDTAHNLCKETEPRPSQQIARSRGRSLARWWRRLHARESVEKKQADLTHERNSSRFRRIPPFGPSAIRFLPRASGPGPSQWMLALASEVQVPSFLNTGFWHSQLTPPAFCSMQTPISGSHCGPELILGLSVPIAALQLQKHRSIRNSHVGFN